jgi:hypothetical protein
MVLISPRWIPHLLSNKQNYVRLGICKETVQWFPKYQRKQFSDIITGDETWVYFFSLPEKKSTKNGLQKTVTASQLPKD